MKWSMKLKIGWAILGITAGPMAAGVFWAQWHNYPTALLALFSAFCAAYLLYTHIAFHKKWIVDWSPARIQAAIVINTALCVLAFIGFVVCLVVAGIRHTNVVAKGENLWLAAVWCWMTFKWTMMSALYTRRYVQSVRHPLLFTSEATQTAGGDVRAISPGV
ncbi:Heme transporter HRG family-containing protein [Aphelenchoides fujianensis]|nr:Heme transporter HRG family-containing protein [Aphelenchoides fujianensis]